MPVPTKTVHLVGQSNAGKSWLRSVVFERRSPLELILEKRELKLVVSKLRSNDFLHVDVWGKEHVVSESVAIR